MHGNMQFFCCSQNLMWWKYCHVHTHVNTEGGGVAHQKEEG